MASRRDPGLYFTSVFGTPSSTAPWAWRFEGHHLSLNVTQLPGQPPSVGPVFFGANPATVPSGVEAGFRLLAGEEDLARELVSLLPEERRKEIRSAIPKSARSRLGRRDRREGDIGYVADWGIFVNARQESLLAEVPRIRQGTAP